MSGGSVYTPVVVDMAAVAAALLGSTTPMQEATTPAAGTLAQASRGDHIHKSPASVTGHVLDSNGEAAIVFTQAFAPAVGANPYPGLCCFPTEAASATPIIAWKAKSWTTDAGGNYTGCTVKAYRGQTLPVQPQLSGSTLLTGVISGINALATSLSGFDITGGSAAGAVFTCIAVKRSTTTA